MEEIIGGRRAGKYEYPITDEMAKRKTNSEGVLDAVSWNAFLAFDIIGDLVRFLVYMRVGEKMTAKVLGIRWLVWVC